MADINQSTFSEIDSSNNQAAPAGWPAGMLPSSVEGAARADMGAIKRWHDQISPVFTSAGTNTITLAHTVAHTVLVAGDRFAFIAGGTNTGAATLAIDGLAAKSILYKSAALVGGEIVVGRPCEVFYDGTSLHLAASQLEVSSTALAAVATSGSAADLSAGTLPPARLAGLNQLSNALGADVALNNTGLFFTGPSIAQGGTGTWFITGQVTVVDTVASADFLVKLWDGTTNLSTTKVSTSKVGGFAVVPVGGVFATPAGNFRISVQDLTSANGSILFNASGGGRDSYIAAFRIA